MNVDGWIVTDDGGGIVRFVLCCISFANTPTFPFSLKSVLSSGNFIRREDGYVWERCDDVLTWLICLVDGRYPCQLSRLLAGPLSLSHSVAVLTLIQQSARHCDHPRSWRGDVTTRSWHSARACQLSSLLCVSPTNLYVTLLHAAPALSIGYYYHASSPL